MRLRPTPGVVLPALGARRRAVLVLLLPLVVGAIGCRQPPTPGGPADFRAGAGGGEWELTELAGQPAPTGGGGRRATLRFESDTARVAGFAGCNRYFGTYTVDGTALRFGPIGMTRMACAEGMELEQQLGAALEATRSYTLNANQLSLLGSNGPVARFERRTP
jgi:heat shock protein HslJ